MATLHVRNVPEPLYELLRDCAEKEGRSIGAQAVAFIQQGVMPHATRRAFRRRRRGAFQRFSTGARDVVVRAEDEARAAGSAHVEPVHVVLALLAADDPAAHALRELGLAVEDLRAGLPQGPGSPPRIPFAPETKKALEGALRESLELRHDHIGTEHLVLALSSDPVFEPVGGAGAVRAAITMAFAHSGAHRGFVPDEADRQYLVADLSGTAEEWTRWLNDAAADGWELMQIVERRAVLRRI